MSAPYLQLDSGAHKPPLAERVKQLFRPLLLAEDGDSQFLWAGDESYAACIAPNTGQVLATIWRGGACRFEPVVYVSISTAIRLLRRNPSARATLRCFPRCAFELAPVMASSIHIAKRCIELDLMTLSIT